MAEVVHDVHVYDLRNPAILPAVKNIKCTLNLGISKLLLKSYSCLMHLLAY